MHDKVGAGVGREEGVIDENGNVREGESYGYRVAPQGGGVGLFWNFTLLYIS